MSTTIQPRREPESVIDRTHGTAVISCRSCRAVFDTGLRSDGGIRFDGVRVHGARAHPDSPSWSFRVEERHPRGDGVA